MRKSGKLITHTNESQINSHEGNYNVINVKIFFNMFHLSDHVINLRVRLSISEINLRFMIKRTVYNIPIRKIYKATFSLEIILLISFK